MYWIRSITKSGLPSIEQVNGGMEVCTAREKNLSLTHSVCIMGPKLFKKRFETRELTLSHYVSYEMMCKQILGRALMKS